MDAQNFQDFIQQLAGAMTQQQAEFMESTNTRWMESMQGFMNTFQEASATNAAAVANAMRHGQGTGDRHEVTINDKSAGGKVKNFQGSTDGRVVQGFLNALELRFAMKNVVTDKEKVMIMGSYLNDTAQIWYASVVGNRYAEIGYADLVEMFKQRFLPVNYENIAREKLIALKQRGSVSTYTKSFTEYMTMVSYPYNNEKMLLDRFIDGLKPGVKVHLEVNRPSTLNSAFEIAQRVDNVIWNRKSGDNNWSAGPRVADPDAMDIDELDSRRRTRTMEEIKSGKCFRCDKFGHKARDCKSKSGSDSKNGRA